jgi:integrase
MTSINGSGTVLKKCQCTAKTKCPHGWTARYWLDGKQRERTFKDTPGKPGSGKKLAADFLLKLAVGKREGDTTFADKSKAAVRFTDYAEAWISRRKAEATRATLRSTMKNYLAPRVGNRTLAQVAGDREAAQAIIDDDAIPVNVRRRLRVLLVSPCNEALKSGRLASHRLRGLDVPDDDERAEFEYISQADTEALAARLGDYSLIAWLGRLAGLRLGESLGVNIADFRNGGTILRLTRQRLANGNLSVMKARKAGDYRDIPVPAALWEKVRNAPADADGYLFPKVWRNKIYDTFNDARDALGLPQDMVPHWLRHCYVSDLLGAGVPITDVARYVGHQNINITFKVYGHLLPDAGERARSVFAAWDGSKPVLKAA